MRVVLTIDVEDWYQTNGFNFDHKDWDKYEDRVEINTRKMLELLDRYNIKATFFVLGYVAERHPNLIRDIYDLGHEIGCHSHYHRLIHTVDQEEIVEDIVKAKAIIEGIIQEPVRFFRAPSWSIGPSEVWLLTILNQLGFSCDSSIQPIKTPLSGFSKAPLTPFKPQVDGKRLDIVEFPTTVFQWGKMRIPYSGGFYFRLFPYWVVRRLLKKQGEEMPTMIYFHPWEIDQQMPYVKSCYMKRMLQSYGVKYNTRKLNRLFNEFEFCTMGTAIKDNDFPIIRLD